MQQKVSHDLQPRVVVGGLDHMITHDPTCSSSWGDFLASVVICQEQSNRCFFSSARENASADSSAIDLFVSS